ncbi:ROK family protein [Lacticigenium naphthae]|uniref:ROK family protein n=1 Tax=Lacticigenium naphthae TaxID=515351 RepID=UPI00040DBE97|nr:ROK family protein [Lacticigenium naphthae]
MSVISFDVGGTAVKHALFNEEGKLVDKNFYPTPDDRPAFMNKIVEIVEHYQEKAQIDSVSFSFPGFIDPQTGFAEASGAIPYFYKQNIKELVGEATAFRYPIFVENDANCAALAEKHSGNGQNVENFLLFTIGTGIGGALYLNDALYRGFQFKAGEMGKMRINYTLDPEKTLHNFCSIHVLIHTYKKYKGLDGLDRVSGEMIFEEVKQNPEVRAIVDKWLDRLCIGILNVVTMLNPEKILIGGGISAHPDLVPYLNRRMERLEDWTKDFQVPIEACAYMNDAGVVGAYVNATQK